jgi:hypothetical protein
MMSRCGLGLAAVILLGFGLLLAADERKERDSKKRSAEAADQADKGAKADGEKDKEGAGGKAKKPEANAVDMEAFRKSKDPAAMEIVALYGEVDKAYAELATARNVALGDDREARKAEREGRTLESKIKRQLKKLEGEVEKYVRPLEKDYEENKRKYESLKTRGDQLSEQGQAKRATEQYQQADRYTGKVEGLKRQIDTAKAFLYFENAVAIEGDDDDGDGRRLGKGTRDKDEGSKSGILKR